MARSAVARSPKGSTRLRARASTSARQAPPVFEGAGQGRRASGWRAPTLSPNAAVLFSLTTLRDRSRSAARSNGYAKGILDKLVTNIVGTGIQPLSQAEDPDARKVIQALWRRWTDESDADKRLDWYGQQSQGVRAWLESGEAFFRLRPRLLSDGLSVPLQVQILEPELCPHTYGGLAPNGNRIRAGLEFDKIGQRVAYYFHPSRPDIDDFNQMELRRVPESSVCHLYDPLRPGQLRGLPHLTQALVKLNELDKFDDATLLRQQLANLFVAFVERPVNPDGSNGIDPVTGQAVTGDEEATLGLEPGIFQHLADGEKVTFSDPPDAGNGYKDFMRQQLMAVCTATGVPYEVLTGDMTGLNDRVIRVVLHEFRRRIQAIQHQLVAFIVCRPVWNAWMDAAVVSGALPIKAAAYAKNPEAWQRVKWQPAGWPYLHPVQDVEASVAAIRAGFTSRSSVVSEQGDDAEAVDQEQSIDNARADGLKLPYDSDPRKAVKVTNTASGGSTTPEPAANDPKEPGGGANNTAVPVGERTLVIDSPRRAVRMVYDDLTGRFAGFEEAVR